MSAEENRDNQSSDRTGLKDDQENGSTESAFQMFVSKRDDPEKEDRCFRKSVNHGIVERNIYGQCPKCNLVNNLTVNKSTFCTECHTMIRHRTYEKLDDNSTSISIT